MALRARVESPGILRRIIRAIHYRGSYALAILRRRLLAGFRAIRFWRLQDHAVLKAPDLQLACVENFHFLYDSKRRVIADFNESAAFVWGRLDGIRTANNLAASIAGNYSRSDQTPDDVRRIVKQFTSIGVAKLVPPEKIKGCVYSRYAGRLGNHLFGHCIARILADRLGFDLVATALEGFPGTRVCANPQFYEVECDERLSGQHIPDSTFRRKTPRNILLQGYFQKYEYYRDYRDEIRNDWLKFDKISLAEDHLVAHVRSGDVWARYSGMDHGLQEGLPVSYYASLIRDISWNRLTVVTSHAEDPIVRRLAELFDCEVRNTSVIEDFRFLASASKLIMSQSTFAWWAAWLSDADEIHFPRTHMWASGGIHSRSLWIEDENRYILHSPVLPKAWRGDEKDEQIMVDC